ncbi:Ala-tRNA(Pro) deacylase [Rhizomicrobium palustre]|uniref:Ala-tRNA(Pro) deacylase n=1 Tax=Rhizomicrobium palustre TaxID=189966 RepID=A0A846MYX1_9PROT|nr:prolyl-tRNA synthetase associated domain-containing protein [Rhizomicrobium palustre]NIK88844.1 Ala-tRNA(Pro) deacylase [Rhizomicrobium palustre]
MSETLPSADARETALYNRFQALGIAYKTYAHPPVFTVEESASIKETIPGGHTKNLFLKDKKGGLWLVVVDAQRRVDLNALAKQLDAPRFSFGSAELLVATLGITPGSVTPFALINDTTRQVRPVLDAEMLKNNPVNYHPLRNDRTTSVTPDDLVRFIEALGYQPVIAGIPEK